MNWFLNLKVGVKLTIFGVMLILFVVATSIQGILALSKMSKEIDVMYNWMLLPIMEIQDAEAGLLGAEGAIFKIGSQHPLNLTPEEIGTYKNKVENDLALTEKTIEKYQSQYLLSSDSKTVQILSESGNAQLLETENESVQFLQANFPKLNSAVKEFLNDGHDLTKWNRTGADLLNAISINLNQLIEVNEEVAALINQNSQRAYADTRLGLLLVIIIALLVSSTLILFITNIITSPLKEMSNVASNVAEGNLLLQCNLSHKDETGILADAFNTMVIQLRNVVKEVIEASEQLAATSQELSSNSLQTAAATEQVAKTVNEMANGAAEQTKQIDEGVVVVNEMAAGIQQIAAKASIVNESASSASSVTFSGQKGAHIATEKIINVKKGTEEVTRAIQELGKGSEEIGQIVDVIKGIADQTNLLALNAAIEAARAGDQGRGFAVVADEVRKLAERSRESADSIAELIGNIQNDTARAVDAMDQGSEQVEEAVIAVKEAVDSFGVIAKEINNVAGQTQQVSATSQQISSGSEQVAAIMERISTVSAQAAASSQEIAASTEEQSASVENVAEQAKNLTQLAGQLKKIVAQFQV